MKAFLAPTGSVLIITAFFACSRENPDDQPLADDFLDQDFLHMDTLASTDSFARAGTYDVHHKSYKPVPEDPTTVKAIMTGKLITEYE